MAAKIVLGTRPKNFKKAVTFPMLDGTEGSIEVLFKYRTRKEFGAFIDELVEAAKVKAPPRPSDGEAPAFSMADLMERTAGSNADYILQVAEGWNLDVEFSAPPCSSCRTKCRPRPSRSWRPTGSRSPRAA
jgi:hypothetical protein